jgi:hypothetical protein
MATHARISSPEDREGITDLMQRALDLDSHAVTLDPGFQKWKYWEPHPLTGAARSYVLDGKERIVGHGCRWPMRILTADGCYDAFHFIDWAADSSHAGAGLQVLRDTCENTAALFSIGGSPTTRRILPALGEHMRRRADGETAPSYRVAGRVHFLSRPLKPMASTFEDNPFEWRTPGRVLRNIYRAALPSIWVSPPYSFTEVKPEEIPQELWPKASSGIAVSARNPELLQHFAGCPVLKQPMSFVLARQGTPVAYFFLVLVGKHVRLADFGPANLDEEVAQQLAAAAQLAAKQLYPQAIRLSAVTSEAKVLAGWLRSGFRQSYEEEIRALVVEPALRVIPQYRLTYLDCDALCL